MAYGGEFALRGLDNGVIPAADARKWAGTGPIDWAAVVFRRRGAAAEALKSDSGRRETGSLVVIETLKLRQDVDNAVSKRARNFFACSCSIAQPREKQRRCSVRDRGCMGAAAFGATVRVRRRGAR